MTRNMTVLVGAALLLLIVVLNAVFIVRQDHQAIVLRFGQYTRVINAPSTDQPGLYFKLPSSRAWCNSIAVALA